MSNPQVPQVVTVGSMAIDDLRTPAGAAPRCLGGAGVHGSLAASFFARVGVVGIVGSDYPADAISLLEGRGMDLSGVVHAEGRTFYWRGHYNDDMSEAITEDTQLNVFEQFQPDLPPAFRKAPYVFLANINPELQLSVLEQMESPRLTLCDSMNLWIDIKKDALTEVLRRVDVVLLNEAEVRLYTGSRDLFRAVEMLLGLGPRAVIVKKGGNGSVMFTPQGSGPLGMGYFAAPAYPVTDLKDPTGAGDSFAGGFVGYLAGRGETSEAAMRTAIVYGTVMASFNVEDFGVRRVSALIPDDISRRFAEMKEFTRYDSPADASG